MTPPAAGPACPDDVVAAVSAGHDVVGAAWAVVAPHSSARAQTRLDFASDGSSVRATTRLVELRADGFAQLLRLRHELARRGWVVGRPPSDPQQLVAWGPGGQLYATYSAATSSVLLELTSDPAPLTPERPAELGASFEPVPTGHAVTHGAAPTR